MKYYKDADNRVYAYEDYVTDDNIKSGLTCISENEALELSNLITTEIENSEMPD